MITIKQLIQNTKDFLKRSQQPVPNIIIVKAKKDFKSDGKKYVKDNKYLVKKLVYYKIKKKVILDE